MRTLPLEFQYSYSKITISGRDNISIRLTTLNFPTIAIYHQFHPPLIPGNGTLTKRFKTLQNVRFTKTSNTSGLQKLFKNVCKKHPYSVFVEICRFCCSHVCCPVFFLCFSFFAIPQSLLISKNDSEDSCTDVLKPDVL